jgi:excisionase family DNA binding protein
MREHKSASDAPKSTNDGFMSLNEAAAYFGVSTRTIRRYVHDRRLKAYMFGGTLMRFRKADLDQWAARWAA